MEEIEMDAAEELVDLRGPLPDVAIPYESWARDYESWARDKGELLPWQKQMLGSLGFVGEATHGTPITSQFTFEELQRLWDLHWKRR